MKAHSVLQTLKAFINILIIPLTMNTQPMDTVLVPPEPSPWSAWIFQIKARCFQIRRFLQDTAQPVKKHPRGNDLKTSLLIADWASDLWLGGDSPRERELQLGKVQNLRIAARALDGIEIPAGSTWSFWKHLGPTTKAKGYCTGRELREGCLVPQIGGGLCQLSGAIYNAALEAGLEIVERHAHSNSSVGSLARIGRDATVFWNYVDLRLRHSSPWRLEVRLSQDQLRVKICSTHQVPRSLVPAETPPANIAPNACSTCGMSSCFRSIPLQAPQKIADRSAVLVDTWWPEWDSFLKNEEVQNRDLLLPLDGKRWNKRNYQWDTSLHSTFQSFPVLTLLRAWKSRRLRSEGARRQQSLLHWDQRLAQAYGQSLRSQHSHLIVTQTLLPYLWNQGWLGGRIFDVLMTRFPLAELHRRLNEAADRHPSSGTCADFRASMDLLESETQALAAARRWITPHTQIAKLGGDKAVVIPWTLPPPTAAPQPNYQGPKRILFPASTLCRKGAYELREALKGLHIELGLLGGVLEGADFWQGIHLFTPTDRWQHETDLVVLPAFVEHNPRHLLKAVTAGKPVIASEACGIRGLSGVIEIQAGNSHQLRVALLKHFHLEAHG